jgi:ribosomal protein S4
LFYGGNKLRIPTFQKYVKRTSISNTGYNIYRRYSPFPLPKRNPLSEKTFLGILETRADVFLFRAGFFETIYQARILCIYGKAVLRNKNSSLSPGSHLSLFEICSVRHYKFVQKRLRYLLEYELISFIPRWIHVSYTYMIGYLIEYPTDIGYPCKGLSWTTFDIFDRGF